MYKDKNIFDVIVIGGGAAGMMAAGRAAECGARVALIEKNKELGRKLAISGGGRCNIANAESDVRTLLSFYGDVREFLFSPFSQFGIKETFQFFESKGLPLVEEARKRVFPKTQDASDVVDVMEKYVRKNNVEIHLHAKVISITKNTDELFAVKTKKDHTLLGKNLVLAAGGLAAPLTGSTGDGFLFAKQFGHTVQDPSPNIVPLTTDEPWVHALSGVSLSFMSLSFIQNGKTHIKKLGKILFTHFGISGPLVLNTSQEVATLLKNGPVLASIDLFPDTNEGDLDKRIWNLFEKNKNKIAKNVLSELLPKHMVLTILCLPHLDLAEREINSITKEERKVLVKTIKNLCFPITGTLGFEKAVIVDGGVVAEEVNFKTMQSKLDEDLYLIGDTLHVNRPSGGYSFQLCWTTGWVAGTHIGRKIHTEVTIV